MISIARKAWSLKVIKSWPEDWERLSKILPFFPGSGINFSQGMKGMPQNSLKVPTLNGSPILKKAAPTGRRERTHGTGNSRSARNQPSHSHLPESFPSAPKELRKNNPGKGIFEENAWSCGSKKRVLYSSNWLIWEISVKDKSVRWSFSDEVFSGSSIMIERPFRQPEHEWKIPGRR